MSIIVTKETKLSFFLNLIIISILTYNSWELTSAEKKGVEADLAKYTGKWEVEAAIANALEGDTGLVMKDKAKLVNLKYF